MSQNVFLGKGHSSFNTKANPPSPWISFCTNALDYHIKKRFPEHQRILGYAISDPRTSAHFLISLTSHMKRKMFRNLSFNSNSSSISMLSNFLGDEVLDVDRDGHDYNLDFRREYRPNAMKNAPMMGNDIRRQQRQQCGVEYHSSPSSKKAVTLQPRVSMTRRGNVINKSRSHGFGVAADRGIHDSCIDAPTGLSINDYMDNDSLISANLCGLPTSISRDIFEKPINTMVKKVVSSSSCSYASSDESEDDDMSGCIERVASSSERAPCEMKGALYTNLTPIPLQNSISKPIPSFRLNRHTSKDLLMIRKKDPPTPHMITTSKAIPIDQQKHRQERQPRLVQHHSYHDFANIKPSKMDSAYIARHVLYSSSSGTTRKHKLPFLLKLHMMLDEATIAHLHEVISWQPHGRAFIVHRSDHMSQLLDLYFGGSKYSSFQRNLNIYGFRRITKGPDAGAYYHQMFIRHKYHLCSRMTRTPVKGTFARVANNPQEEPNLYLYPPVTYHSTPYQSQLVPEKVSNFVDKNKSQEFNNAVDILLKYYDNHPQT